MDYEFDAIYIPTPVHLHAEQAIAAAERGKHILCEKPMALNVAEGDRIIDACRLNNVKLGVAYYRHFYPVVRRVKELIDSGELGVTVFVQVNAFEWFDPPGPAMSTPPSACPMPSRTRRAAACSSMPDRPADADRPGPNAPPGSGRTTGSTRR